MRVDALPNKLYRYNGVQWMQIAKETDTYLNKEYVTHLADQVLSGITDIEELTEQEQEEVQYAIQRRSGN